MMTRLFKRKVWHELFEAGVALKGINSVWQILGGLFLLTRLHSWLEYILVFFSRHQLLGGPEDFLFSFVSSQIHRLDIVSVRTFVGAYLLFHGILNAFLAYNLYRNRLWSYPVMMMFIIIFLVYQSYRLVHTFSLTLLFITIFDIAFLVLTWHEYKAQKEKLARS